MNFRQNNLPCSACAGMQSGVGMPTLYPATGALAQTPTTTQNLPLPTGAPLGPTYTPLPSPTTNFVQGEAPQTVLDTAYTQGYLRTQIGRTVRIEFLLGNNLLVDRTGVLAYVGASYLILRELNSDDQILCDLYSIKFVRFYY